jgi:metal-responsive CopG/Arc/MetJ family transcriptional regulator
MADTSNQKVTVSLPQDALHYADSYKDAHGMNRSEVLVLALKALRERELAEGYKALAEEQAKTLTDSGMSEVLEQLEW